MVDQYSAHDPSLDDDIDEEDDDLSLCDLALDDYQLSDHPDQSSSSEFFEFFSGSSELCPAEDIIFCGKLVPYQSSPAAVVSDERQSALRKRSESLPEMQRRRRSEEARHMMRNSRSLDYHRSPPPETEKKGSSSRPRWYLLMFGMVKVPSEMELRDIRSRQFRRDPASNQKGSSSSSWGLLRALSCKDHTSVAVATPIGRRVPETE